MTDEWLNPRAVAEWLQLDDKNDARVEHARKAAAAYVRQVRPDLFPTPAVDGLPGEAAVLAGMIATKRLHARAGGSGFAEFGASVAFLQLDPDVSALLGLGPHETPRVG